MNFLELCQETAEQSGVISRTAIATTTGNVGKARKLCGWVSQAYENVQNARPDWLWLRTKFTSPATASGGTGLYTANSFGITTRFGMWSQARERPDGTVFSPQTIYEESVGLSDQGELEFIDWDSWWQLYGRGVQTENRPRSWSVSPQMEFALGPLPNGAFIIPGEYQKGPQVLSDIIAPATSPNENTPEMPLRFHRLIVYEALRLLVVNDEAPPAVLANVKEERTALWQYLERDQLPTVIFGGNGF